MGFNPSHRKDNPNLPVETVSWNEVQAFIQELNIRERELKLLEEDICYRLPTEAEWEYAARASSTTAYSFDLYKLHEYAWYGKNSEGETHPVGTRKPNAWGLYDMHGNVWEWVQDWYGTNYYDSSPDRNPSGPSQGQFKVLRGGSWSDLPKYLLTYGRFRLSPETKNSYTGFRCAKSEKK